ncbi:MAG: VVA0879 family protein [Thermodesulfobacteriota bacterium]|nr:VVA0879 family protein [Thermodesulfobacteriota bacterium]
MKYTHTEWLSELKERFGDDLTKWAFVCPACGKVSTVQEFKDAGADPNDAYQTCIGRHTGKGSPTKNSKEGCNWAAFGLYGGDVIVTEDKKEVPVFSMADPAALGNNEEDEN